MKLETRTHYLRVSLYWQRLFCCQFNFFAFITEDHKKGLKHVTATYISDDYHLGTFSFTPPRTNWST